MKNILLFSLLLTFAFTSCKNDKKEGDCECEFVKKENCDGQGANCEYTFKCPHTGKEYTETGTSDRAKKLCEIDCCNKEDTNN